MDDKPVGPFHRSQRGATLVQYVLAIALIALIGLFAVTRVGSGSKKSFDAAHTGVTTHDAPGSSGGAGDTGGNGGGTGGGGVGAPGGTTTPPTTAPATTAPPAPTTTAAPTTTTTTAPPTTTTTAAPKAVSVTFLSSQGIADSSSIWHGRAELAVRTGTGEGVHGAQIELVIEGWASTGGGGTRRSSTTARVATTATGRVIIDTSGLQRSGSNRVNSVTIRVQGVDVPGGFEWGGASPSATINRV